MRAIFKSAKIGKNTRCKQQFAYDDAADMIGVEKLTTHKSGVTKTMLMQKDQQKETGTSAKESWTNKESKVSCLLFALAIIPNIIHCEGYHH